MKRLALLLALWASPALAQGVGAQGNTDLDRLYAARDWRGVSERMRLANSEAEARATLQWAAGKTMEGAPHVGAPGLARASSSSPFADDKAEKWGRSRIV